MSMLSTIPSITRSDSSSVSPGRCKDTLYPTAVSIEGISSRSGRVNLDTFTGASLIVLPKMEVSPPFLFSIFIGNTSSKLLMTRSIMSRTTMSTSFCTPQIKSVLMSIPLSWSLTTSNLFSFATYPPSLIAILWRSRWSSSCCRLSSSCRRLSSSSLTLFSFSAAATASRIACFSERILMLKLRRAILWIFTVASSCDCLSLRTLSASSTARITFKFKTSPRPCLPL